MDMDRQRPAEVVRVRENRPEEGCHPRIEMNQWEGAALRRVRLGQSKSKRVSPRCRPIERQGQGDMRKVWATRVQMKSHSTKSEQAPIEGFMEHAMMVTRTELQPRMGKGCGNVRTGHNENRT